MSDPAGRMMPITAPVTPHMNRVRRFAATVLLLTGVLALVSTVAHAVLGFVKTGDTAVFQPSVLALALARAMAIFFIISLSVGAGTLLKVNTTALLIVAAATGALIEMNFSLGNVLFGDLVPPRSLGGPPIMVFAAKFTFLFLLGKLIMFRTTARKSKETGS